MSNYTLQWFFPYDKLFISYNGSVTLTSLTVYYTTVVRASLEESCLVWFISAFLCCISLFV